MKIVLVSFCLTFSLSLIFVGCNKQLELNEYVNKIIDDTDYKKAFQNHNYKIYCSYRPGSILALNELKNKLFPKNILTRREFDIEGMKYGNSFYFNLNIGLISGEGIIKENSADKEEYSNLLSELTYNMYRDFYMIIDQKDTVYALTYNYSNTYSIKPDIELLFAFPKAKNYKKLEMVYDDKIFDIGEKIKFVDSSREIEKSMPILKLN